MKKYILYVDGQLGLPFDTLEEAKKAAEYFKDFDTFICETPSNKTDELRTENYVKKYWEKRSLKHTDIQT